MNMWYNVMDMLDIALTLCFHMHFAENHYSLTHNPEQRPQSYNYFVYTPRAQFVTVNVKACEDAWIAVAAKAVSITYIT